MASDNTSSEKPEAGSGIPEVVVEVHTSNEATETLAALREKLMRYGGSDWERR